jgi:Type VI secretion system/phage-baseplate injector OB domain
MNDDDEGPKFPGVYRGRVINNQDPLGKGRVTAQCPDVHGLLPTTWAMPCAPMTGLQSGIYIVPPLNAGVWIMFEEGDINHPIWIGC